MQHARHESDVIQEKRQGIPLRRCEIKISELKKLIANWEKALKWGLEKHPEDEKKLSALKKQIKKEKNILESYEEDLEKLLVESKTWSYDKLEHKDPWKHVSKIFVKGFLKTSLKLKEIAAKKRMSYLLSIGHDNIFSESQQGMSGANLEGLYEALEEAFPHVYECLMNVSGVEFGGKKINNIASTTELKWENGRINSSTAKGNVEFGIVRKGQSFIRLQRRFESWARMYVELQREDKSKKAFKDWLEKR